MSGPQMSNAQMSGPQKSGPQMSGPQMSSPQMSHHAFNDAILPAFPPDESANASDGQAVAKWLFTPRPDGRPKFLKFIANSPDQWSSTMELIKAAFSNASSPVTFRIHFWSSSPLDSVVPFDLINEVTGEKLYLLKAANNFWLDRCPIGWDERKWINVREEFNDRQNPIDIWIREAHSTTVFSTPLLPGRVIIRRNELINWCDYVTEMI